MRYAMLWVLVAAAACDSAPAQTDEQRRATAGALIEARRVREKADAEQAAAKKAAAAAEQKRKYAEIEERYRPRTKAEQQAFIKETADRRVTFAARLQSGLEMRNPTSVRQDSIGGVHASRYPVTVKARGKDLRTYRVDWELCDGDVIETIAMDKDMIAAVQDFKVNRLECSDGDRTWTKTWR